MTCLNLGCGLDFRGEDWINHDRIKHDPRVDVAHDLNVLPWPWADSSAKVIIARSVFEHLDNDLVVTLNECWRILRPGGRIFVKLPYWNSEMSHDDPTHRWFYGLGTFDQFDPDTKRGQQYGFYTERKWRIVNPARLNKTRSSISATLEVRK